MAEPLIEAQHAQGVANVKHLQYTGKDAGNCMIDKAEFALPAAACLLHHTNTVRTGQRAFSGALLLPVSAVQAPCG